MIQQHFIKFAAISIIIFTLSITVYSQKFTPADFVNPFIGTDDMGHTFPGAAVPFGLVQLSPETDTVMYSYGKGYNPDVYRYCSGYQYRDNTIVGFTHTHFNGTGHSDLGDILIMPTIGLVKMNPGTKDKPGSGYRSRFTHKKESASPGYYSVFLDDYTIKAELTATEHCGFHKYTFPESDSAHIILDLTSGIYNYEGKIIWSFLRIENDTLITGFIQTRGWARMRYVYFAISFSKPIQQYGIKNDEELLYKGFWRKWNENDNFPERAGKKLIAHFDYTTKENEVILIKTGISGVSCANAILNLQTEITDWDFSAITLSAKKKWNNELSKITIEADDTVTTNFYTSLYHTFLSPVIFSDVNGQYRGLNQNLHFAGEGKNYTIFSLWDTYRALHPLFTIIQPKRTIDMINSMLNHYDQSVHHILPIWSHWANENWCMIGYHAVPVIADAYMKGLRGFDTVKAMKAVLASSNYKAYDGIGMYKKLGFVAEDNSSNSASKTLEYAYDDWTIYRMAVIMGDKTTAGEYLIRSFNYKNIFDYESKFMRARKTDQNWLTPFDPLSTHGQGYIEGNSWNYSLYIPHDIKGFMTLLGGREHLITWLDSLFTMTVPEKYFSESEDVTKAGAIGNYVHGNEPSHHVPYMYCYAGAPWKTQERVKQIMKTMYKPKPDGLCGNDDCGQMSAWYIFSAMGFYPVSPGSNEYVIGSPSVRKAVINLESGKVFKIITKGFSEKNIYIKNLILNGKSINRSFITHEEIMNGGELIFVLCPEPNKKFATEPESVPYSLTK